MKSKKWTACALSAMLILLAGSTGFADRGQPPAGRNPGNSRGGHHYAPPRGGNPHGGGSFYAPRPHGHHGPVSRHYYYHRPYGWPVHRHYHHYSYRYDDYRWGSPYYFGGSYFEPGFGFFFGSSGWW
jgi:hypothetical protein